MFASIPIQFVDMWNQVPVGFKTSGLRTKPSENLSVPRRVSIELGVVTSTVP